MLKNLLSKTLKPASKRAAAHDAISNTASVNAALVGYRDRLDQRNERVLKAREVSPLNSRLGELARQRHHLDTAT